MDTSYQLIGEQFVTAYYNAFDVDRCGIVSLYHAGALLTYNTFEVQGHEAILKTFQEKLTFKKVEHKVSSKKFQPMENGNILIFVTGKLKADEDTPLDFSETFVLKNDAGNWCIMHDIFSLVLHDF